MRKLIITAACAVTVLAFVTGCTRPATVVVSPRPTRAQALQAFAAMYPDLQARDATATWDGWTVTGELPPPDSSYPGPIEARAFVRPGGSGPASATVDGITWYGDTNLAVLSEVPPTKIPYPDTLGMAIAYIPAVEETHAVVTSLNRFTPNVMAVTLVNGLGHTWHLQFEEDLTQDGWLLDEQASDVMRTAQEEHDFRFLHGADGHAMLAALRVRLERRLRQPLRLDVVDVGSLETTGTWAQVNVEPRRRNGKAIDYRRLKEFREAIKEGAFDSGAQALMHEVRGRWVVVACNIGATDTEWDSWGPFARSDD